jgi:hypothetical protein
VQISIGICCVGVGAAEFEGRGGGQQLRLVLSVVAVDAFVIVVVERETGSRRQSERILIVAVVVGMAVV